MWTVIILSKMRALFWEQPLSKKHIGDKKGIRRYGSCILPMDETPGAYVPLTCPADRISFDAELTSASGSEICPQRW